ncbi:MAG: DUF427 domain-containing protein [Beijerinckiaceae bacterium]
MRRPAQRIAPGPGQESVWDYPRPPRLEPVAARLRVEFASATIADTIRGLRLLETSHPPVYYFPPEDVASELLRAETGSSFCEFKGVARYWSIAANGRFSRAAAWSYPQPTGEYAALKDHLAVYASKVDACFVGEEKVQAQAGDFYGGWITARIAGPFKGPPGTRFW